MQKLTKSEKNSREWKKQIEKSIIKIDSETWKTTQFKKRKWKSFVACDEMKIFLFSTDKTFSCRSFFSFELSTFKIVKKQKN